MERNEKTVELQRSLNTSLLLVTFFSSALFSDAKITKETTSLKKAVPKNVLIGCAVTADDVKNPTTASLIKKEFSCLTPEYELMPEHMVADDWRFTFERGDKVVAFAEKHNLPVYGHMLIWHFVTRKWLFEDDTGHPLPREQALKNMERYIGTVVKHYKGRVKAWDVVNEALSDQAGEFLKDTPALRAIGEDYIEKAFEFAHAADPEAELYYNDYNIEQPGKLEKACTLIRGLKAKGVPIDAVGVQGHWLLNWPPPEMISTGINTLAKEGVNVMVTELDVDLLPRTHSGADMNVVEQGENPYINALPDEIQERLAIRYSEIMNAIIQNKTVTMINFWGVHDGRSWLNNYPVKGRTNHPLLFDRKCSPKPAYNAVINTLKKDKNAP